MRLREVCVSVVMCLTLIAGAHAQGPAIKTVKPGVLTVAIDNDMPYCKEEGGKIIGVAVSVGGDGVHELKLPNCSFRFIKGDTEIMSGLDFRVGNVAAVCDAARARGLKVSNNAFPLGGVTFRLVS